MADSRVGSQYLEIADSEEAMTNMSTSYVEVLTDQDTNTNSCLMSAYVEVLTPIEDAFAGWGECF